jgi:hypothetical protein
MPICSRWDIGQVTIYLNSETERIMEKIEYGLAWEGLSAFPYDAFIVST